MRRLLLIGLLAGGACGDSAATLGSADDFGASMIQEQCTQFCSALDPSLPEARDPDSCASECFSDCFMRGPGFDPEACPFYE